MFGLVFSPFVRMVRNPLLLLPTLVFLAVSYLLMFFFLDAIADVLFFFFFPVPGVSADLMLPFLVTSIPLQVLGVLLFLFFSFALFCWMAFSISRSMLTDKPVLDSMLEGLSNWMKTGGLAVALFCAGTLYFALGAALFFLLSLAEGASLMLLSLLILAYFLFGFFLALKFSFSFALLAKTLNARKALQESWNASRGRFWHVLAFLFLVAILYSVFLFLMDAVLGLFPESVLGDAVFLLLALISLSYLQVALAGYCKAHFSSA
ncbi:MAG: hypothetical protein HY917_05510 [Candidatus Diapherotrites archaeon]|nr:hypothetical protein [Candidatus Diapherotrites archaeon]